MFDSLNNMIREFEALQEAFRIRGQEELKKVFKEFFEKAPEIKVVRWVQYTPYFNDGDPCEFRVCDPSFSNVEDVSRLGSYEGDIEDPEEGEFFIEGMYGSYSDMKKYHPEVKLSKETHKACADLSNIMCSSSMEPILLAMFEDHAQVTVTKDGFDVDSYDHD
jgi:hypothetical protein